MRPGFLSLVTMPTWLGSKQSPDDHKIGGDQDVSRRVLARSRTHVTYEDLASMPAGWYWSRWEVSLRPPDRWHGDGVGNYRSWSVDYRLRALPDGGTELEFRGTRRSSPLGRPSPAARRVREGLLEDWRKFSRALDADYRKASRARHPRTAKRSPR